MMNEQRYCGIDVAKRHVVIGLSGRKQTKTFANNAKDIQHAVEYLKHFSPALIVLESTGGLEIPLAKALHHAGFAVVIANPRQTHQFAQAKSLAKTDAKDAQMLASYAKMLALDGEVEKHLYTPPTPEAEQIEQATQAFDDTLKKFNGIKEIGLITSATLMSMLPELGKLNHKQIASLQTSN